MPTKKTDQLTDKEIQDHYVAYVSKSGEHPNDIYEFCIAEKISDVNFLRVYNDLKEVHHDVWKGFLTSTLEILAEDDQFSSFSGREQLLAFYYTHIEILKANRAFILVDRYRMKVPIPLPRFMVGYKEEFIQFSKGLINYAMQTGEVADRKFLNAQYSRGVWAQLYWLVQFWSKDDSNEFETTDAAIEKAVNLSLEIVRPGPVDSLIDFAKFMYQNR